MIRALVAISEFWSASVPAGWARPPPRRRLGRWRRGRGARRWSARSIRRRVSPTRSRPAASAPSRSRSRPPPAACSGSRRRRQTLRRTARHRADVRAAGRRAGRRSRDARRIFDNTIYRQITTTLTGSQEYAAMLALHGFATGGQFDLVVLDTPPTSNALDFLDAPARIALAVDNPVLKWFARPDAASSNRRLSLQWLRSGGALDRAPPGQDGRQPLHRRHRRVPGRLPGGAGRLPRPCARDRCAPARSGGRPSCWC